VESQAIKPRAALHLRGLLGYHYNPLECETGRSPEPHPNSIMSLRESSWKEGGILPSHRHHLRRDLYDPSCELCLSL